MSYFYVKDLSLSLSLQEAKFPAQKCSDILRVVWRICTGRKSALEPSVTKHDCRGACAVHKIYVIGVFTLGCINVMLNRNQIYILSLHTYYVLYKALHSYTGLYTPRHSYTVIQSYTLTYIYTQVYIAIHCCTGLHTSIQGYTRLHGAIHTYKGLYRAIHVYTELYRTIQRYTGLYTAIQGHS